MNSDAKTFDRRSVLFIGALLLVLLLVQISGSAIWLAVTTAVAISSIAAMALTVLVGWAGQPSLLAGALMLVGGLCAAAIPAETPGSLLWSLMASAVAGGAVGAIAALPSKRLSGTYLLLSTMALQFIIVDVVNYVQSKTGKTAGYSLAHPNLIFLHFDSQAAWLWISVIAVVLEYLYLIRLRHTRVGRSLAIIRDDAGAASVAGVKVSMHLTWIFAVTSALIAMSGALNGYYTQNVTYEQFDVLISISFFVMIVLGGPGSLIGAVLGCAFVVGMPQVLPLFSNAASQSVILPYIEQLLYGVIGMIVLIGRFGRVPIISRIAKLLSTKSRSSALEGGGSTRAGLAQNLGSVSDVLGLEEPDRTGIEQPPTSSTLSGVGGASKERKVVLRLSNLQVSYKGSVQAVRGVDLVIGEGQSVAVVGPNGAGKTSVLSAVAGFPVGSEGRISEGRVLLTTSGNEVLINSHSPEQRGRLGIAFVPAEDKVFNELMVHEHLRLATPRGTSSSAAASLRAELFEVFPEVKPLLDRRAGLLSGGQRQQLALMCALMRKPRILIVDELSLGLSPVAVERVVEALLRVKEMGTTSLLLAEQNVSVAFAISDVIVVMSGGFAKSVGGPSQEYEESVRLQFVGGKSENHKSEDPRSTKNG